MRVQIEYRAKAALKRSAIFPLTTLDAYDFDYPDSIDRDLIARAATLDFIRDKTNCVLVGPSGVGKTHIAKAIGQLACLHACAAPPKNRVERDCFAAVLRARFHF